MGNGDIGTLEVVRASTSQAQPQPSFMGGELSHIDVDALHVHAPLI